MRYFPLFLDLDNRKAVIVGGGDEALRKVRLLLKTKARINIIAPALHDELACRKGTREGDMHNIWMSDQGGAGFFAEAAHDVIGTRGKSRLCEDVGQHQCGQRSLFRRLHHR